METGRTVQVTGCNWHNTLPPYLEGERIVRELSAAGVCLHTGIYYRDNTAFGVTGKASTDNPAAVKRLFLDERPHRKRLGFRRYEAACTLFAMGISDDLRFFDPHRDLFVGQASGLAFRLTDSPHVIKRVVDTEQQARGENECPATTRN